MGSNQSILYQCRSVKISGILMGKSFFISMKIVKEKIAKAVDEFDRRFDNGEDIHELIDMSKARVIRHGKKIRIAIDDAEELA